MPRPAREFRRPAPAGTASLRDDADPLLVRAAARVELARRQAGKVYGRGGDPWAFVRDCVWTKDEARAASGEVIRRYPDVTYAAYLTGLWQRERLLAVAKSRRLVLTWLFVALYTWLALTTPGARIGFCARKEGKTESEGSNELVQRAKFILDHLPPFFALDGEAEYHQGYLRLPNGAEIIGFGAGSDQARQLGMTGFLADEFGFWEQVLESWRALRPTIEGGGRITLLSSATVGPWKALVHDQL